METLHGQRGLTLLELLIVLMLMGLLTALAAPRVGAQLEGARQRALQRQLQSVIGELPLRAFHLGQEMIVSSSDLVALLGDEWPDDVRLEMAAPLRYGPTGVASGGELQLM